MRESSGEERGGGGRRARIQRITDLARAVRRTGPAGGACPPWWEGHAECSGEPRSASPPPSPPGCDWSTWQLPPLPPTRYRQINNWYLITRIMNLRMRADRSKL